MRRFSHQSDLVTVRWSRFKIATTREGTQRRPNFDQTSRSDRESGALAGADPFSDRAATACGH